MSISKEMLEKAFKETLDDYEIDENKKTFDELEKIASKFSDTVMRRSLKMALDEARAGKKKPYVKSVVNMLNQLDSENEFF